jgi:hypothetical protein
MLRMSGTLLKIQPQSYPENPTGCRESAGIVIENR